MQYKTLSELKARFASTDRPTAADFADLIDTLGAMPLPAAQITANPTGPAAGDLSGYYPDPLIKSGVVTLRRWNIQEALQVPMSESDIAIPVFQKNTRSFVYRNWWDLPGILVSGANQSTIGDGSGTTPGTGATSGSVTAAVTDWKPFPALSSFPYALNMSSVPAGDIISVWGEAKCINTITPPSTSSQFQGYSANDVVPISFFYNVFTISVGLPNEGDVTVFQLFNAFLAGTIPTLRGVRQLADSVGSDILKVRAASAKPTVVLGDGGGMFFDKRCGLECTDLCPGEDGLIFYFMANSIGTRKQRLLLNGDDLLDPSFFAGHNADAAISGIQESASGDQQFPVLVGGTNNKSFSDQTLLFYDQATDSIRSSGITVQDLQTLQTTLRNSGPFIDQCIRFQKTDFASPYLPGTGAFIALPNLKMTVTPPAGCEWVWARVVFSAAYVTFSNVRGQQPTAEIEMRLNQEAGPPANWVNTGGPPYGSYAIGDIDGDIRYNWMQTPTYEGPVSVSSARSPLVINFLARYNPWTNQVGGQAYVLAWYRPFSTVVAPENDPNLVPIPSNYTATNFQLLYPNAAGVPTSNVERVPLINVFENGGNVLIDWGPAAQYFYALKVLYTITQTKANGTPTQELLDAHTWLYNILLAETASTSQVGLNQPVSAYGASNLQVSMKLSQQPDPNGYYERDWTLKTLNYT